MGHGKIRKEGRKSVARESRDELPLGSLLRDDLRLF
jgi:hypothetical protein